MKTIRYARQNQTKTAPYVRSDRQNHMCVHGEKMFLTMHLDDESCSCMITMAIHAYKLVCIYLHDRSMKLAELS